MYGNLVAPQNIDPFTLFTGQETRNLGYNFLDTLEANNSFLNIGSLQARGPEDLLSIAKSSVYRWDVVSAIHIFSIIINCKSNKVMYCYIEEKGDESLWLMYGCLTARGSLIWHSHVLKLSNITLWISYSTIVLLLQGNYSKCYPR